jgi:hypothetical protein
VAQAHDGESDRSALRHGDPSPALDLRRRRGNGTERAGGRPTWARPPAGAATRGYGPGMILLAVRDLLFRSKLQAAAERLGVPFRFAPREGGLAQATRDAGAGVLLVDLTQPGVLEEVRAAKAAGAARVVGFLGHLQTDLMRDAAAAGVDEVLTRGQLVSRMDDLLRGAAPPDARPPPAG